MGGSSKKSSISIALLINTNCYQILLLDLLRPSIPAGGRGLRLVRLSAKIDRLSETRDFNANVGDGLSP
jgi:hypothetical protein